MSMAEHGVTKYSDSRTNKRERARVDIKFYRGVTLSEVLSLVEHVHGGLQDDLGSKQQSPLYSLL